MNLNKLIEYAKYGLIYNGSDASIADKWASLKNEDGSEYIKVFKCAICGYPKDTKQEAEMCCDGC